MPGARFFFVSGRIVHQIALLVMDHPVQPLLAGIDPGQGRRHQHHLEGAAHQEAFALPVEDGIAVAGIDRRHADAQAQRLLHCRQPAAGRVIALVGGQQRRGEQQRSRAQCGASRQPRMRFAHGAVISARSGLL